MADNPNFTIAEFYSGIGGLHYGFQAALPHLPHLHSRQISIHPFDVNENANLVYKHNHATSPSTQDITSLTSEDLDALNADLWLMSPPCQPYTRNGPRKFSKDKRAVSFLKMLEELPKMSRRPGFILLENVLGFEASDTFETLTKVLKDCDYTYQGFMINPLQIGIPNSRPRFFLLAKRKHSFACPEGTGLKDNGAELIFKALSSQSLYSPPSIQPVSAFLEAEAENDPTLELSSGQLWKSGGGYDMIVAEGFRSCCFTKSYGKYFRGTGSVLRRATDEELIAYAEELPDHLGEAEASVSSSDSISENEDDDEEEEQPEPPAVSDHPPNLHLQSSIQKILTHYYHLRTTNKSRILALQATQTAHLMKTKSGKPRRLSAKAKRELDQQRGRWWEGVDDPCPLEVFRARFLSPREVASLQGFPREFGFPDEVPILQRWKLLGNSLNVKVVEVLVRYLFA
ncbi:C-5 cytosine-specific DNA methylase [Dinochytrium kinnereticum]|nr:C-5 cytosine-specific DNA methylase [Dinochytrium kinnereticum]